MTHFGSLFGPPFLGGNPDSDYLNAYQFLAKNWPKWVILGSLARARARARGDKIDFVLEMPFWGLKMDFPKMTHFGPLFGPFSQELRAK